MNLDFLLSAPATIAILVANVVLSVWGFNSPRLIDATMFDMRRVIKERQYQRLITSGFVHASPAHLLINMLTLFFLGPALEYVIDSVRFAGVYFACLLAGSLWTLLEHHRDLGYRALGASGAISGVTTAFAMFAPMAMLYVFFIVPVPAILFAVLYVGFSAYASGRIRDGVGHAAHLGGALMGVTLVCIFWPEAPRAMWDQILHFFGQ